jgi:branched-chain amino acid transport system ATP-binding protein
MAVVLGLAQRVAVLHHGQLLACGEPGDVMANQTVQLAYLGDPL